MKQQKDNWVKILFSFAAPCKGKMALSVFCAILSVAGGFIPFWAVYEILLAFINQNVTLNGILIWCLVGAAGYLLRVACHGISTILAHISAYTILEGIRLKIADRLMKAPLGEVMGRRIGYLKNIIMDKVEDLEPPLAHMIPELTSNLLLPVAIFIWMLVIDWRMGLASLITIPLCIPFIFGMLRGYGEKMETYLRSGNEMNAALVEYVGGIQVIKAFGRTGASFGKFSNSVNFFHDSTLDWWRQCWFWMAAVKAILPSTMLGSLPIGAYLYMNQQISLPILVACIIIPIGAIAPLMKLASAGEMLTTITANLKPVKDFLATPEQKRPDAKVEFDGSAYSFENVSFSYNDTKEVLHGISFQTKPGTMTAIVGASGSGKSTIAKLMAGFWDATSGIVRYGGKDIKDIPFDQLMQEISYVAQDNFLFNKSIRENIRMGNPQASDQEVEAAAKAANCHDFIMKLPQGYDTFAGDAGDRLSGGERQRITIARAMLKQSNLIILDEATAYADPESEAQIQEAVGRLVHGKTLVVVAHRLSTIQNAEQILVVDKGNIIARGTQKELLEQCPLYHRMWQQYVGASNLEKKEG